jgi:asparaginyl-tRNA synthetase
MLSDPWPFCYPTGMAVVTVEGIGAHVGETVTLRGWLALRRSSGKVHFLQLRDGTGTIQCVMGKRDVPEDVFALGDHLPQ